MRFQFLISIGFGKYSKKILSTFFSYTSKVITDIRKLVLEGFIKISRTTQDVEIAVEKVLI